MKMRMLLMINCMLFGGCVRRPPNLHTVKKQVAHYYDSGAFEREISKVVNRALKHFQRTCFADVVKPTVIIDIDETVLHNYQALKKIDFGYKTEWARTAAQEAVTPTNGAIKKLYDYLVSRCVHIIFLTGRRQSLYDATYKNLVSHGYTTFDSLIMKPNDMHESVRVYKMQQRTRLTAQGYTIIGSIGDQYGDLWGPDTGYRVKLPNYLYILD